MPIDPVTAGMLGKLGGAAIAGLGSIGGSMISSDASSRGAKAAAKYTERYNRKYATWSARELPTLNRQGMEAAGFNPILAINDGTGVQGNVQVSPSEDYLGQGVATWADRMGNAVAGIGDVLRLDSDLKTAESQRDLLRAQAAKTLTDSGYTTFKQNHPELFTNMVMSVVNSVANSASNLRNTAVEGVESLFDRKPGSFLKWIEDVLGRDFAWYLDRHQSNIKERAPFDLRDINRPFEIEEENRRRYHK